MKKQTTAAIAASVLTLATVCSASAQTRPSTDSPSSKMQREAWTMEPGAMEASKLIGTKVKSTAGKDIGEIDQLIVDSTSGKVSHVVIGRGGVAGVGEKKVVLMWSDVTLQPDPNNRNRMIASVDQGKLDSAPRYEARHGRETTPAASPRTTTTPGTRSTPEKKY